MAEGYENGDHCHLMGFVASEKLLLQLLLDLVLLLLGLLNQLPIADWYRWE